MAVDCIFIFIFIIFIIFIFNFFIILIKNKLILNEYGLLADRRTLKNGDGQTLEKLRGRSIELLNKREREREKEKL